MQWKYFCFGLEWEASNSKRILKSKKDLFSFYGKFWGSEINYLGFNILCFVYFHKLVSRQSSVLSC